MTDSTASSADLLDADQPTFDALPLSPEVRKAVDDLGYTHPTPVQKAVFETAASGRDVVVQARTGTGKTAAFGLPVVDRLVDTNTKAPQVLILSPTRELALQIGRELENLAKHNGVTCTAVYGGAGMQPQIDAIRRGAHVIAGTPGRVLDHLERGTLDPNTLKALVLDESDEMLSMGFLPQITRIMEQLPEKHQTLLFSATLPPDVKRIAETRLTDPEFITLSGDHIGALSIDHFVYRSTGSKADELIQLLEIENPESAIVFCNTRDQTKRLAGALKRKGFSADWLNADLAQNDREKVMKATREGKLRFLVCTDVAARGIDISHLTHVINADFPESTENYVHRTGRTGRAGKTGTAISLITPQDTGNLYMLRLTYKIFPVERDLPSAGDVQTRKEADVVNFLFKEFSGQAQLPGDRSLARRILTSDFAETIVAGLVRDHLGSQTGADERAAGARRDKAPAPVETKKKEKKSKKKDGKERKKAKADETAEKPEKSAKKAKNVKAERAVEQTEDKRPAKAEAKKSTKNERPVDRKKDKPLKTEKPDKAPKAKKPKSSPAAKTTENEEMEVVSAASLLGEDERALLRGDDAPPPKRKAPKNDDEGVGRIFVDAGKRDQVYKDDFFDTMEDNGFDVAKVVFITVRDTHTFIGVEVDDYDAGVKSLDGHEVGGLEVSAEKARPRRS